MGLTHYWEREPELSEVMFQSVIGDLQKILGIIEIPLAGSEGNGEPYFSLDKILFNGIKGQNCENFKVLRIDVPRKGRTKVNSYCKTEELPYELAVQIALIIMKHYLGGAFSVFSDEKEADWEKAKQMCSKILGYGDDFQLDAG